MFGYISPDTPYLFKKDDVLYEALYCGLCKSIAKGCGQCARTALTYDMAFTSAIVHNIRGVDVKIEKKRCIVHWFKKRPCAERDEISLVLGYANTALAYYKLCDDKADGEKRGILRHLYRRGYKKAKKAHPETDKILSEFTSAQKKLEEANCSVLDEAAEPTAVMMQKLSRYVLGEAANPSTDSLFYAIGKWVYLIDALDDYDKDLKKGRYNPYFNCFRAPSRQKLTAVCGEEIRFLFDSLFKTMRDSLPGIKFNFNHDLTDNIILRGIPKKSREVFYGKPQKGEKGEKNEQKKS